MDDRAVILGALAAEPRSQPSAVRTVYQPASEEIGALWDQFGDMLQALGGRFGGMDDLARLLERPNWADDDARACLALIPSLEGPLSRTSSPPVTPGLGSLPPSSKTSHLEEGGGIWDVEVGFTMADLAVAETGTLVLSAGPGRARLASLAPPIHVALVRRTDIVRSLEEAMLRLSDRTTVFVTGPSRTADIEGILIRGVHGPGELWVVPI